jgi:PhzF family phenazine biosynthesis protein
MSRNVRVFQVDAFTSERFCGNPAGVVLAADALTPAEMQTLARELNNGDTAFLLEPDGADHDLRVRFFTPTREAAFVGHATLAAHAVLAQLGLPSRPRQKQSSGIVSVRRLEGAPSRIAISQPPPPLGRAPTQPELQATLVALGLTPSNLDTRCPPMYAGPGTRLLLGVRDAAVLALVRPDFARLTALSAESGASGYFLFALHEAGGRVASEARMFCPALGINEDPVSGNAHAMLGVYLLHHNLLTLASGGFEGAQGRHMARPGLVSVLLEPEQQALRAIAIAGTASIVFATSLDFP